MLRFLFVLSLLACVGCGRQPEYFPVPEQRHAIQGVNLVRARMFVRMNDEDAGSHFVQDISGKVEGGTWRWTGKKPTLKMLLVKTDGLKFKSDFTLWAGCMKQTGPVTITFWIGDRALDRVRYDTPGYKSFEKPVPSEWLQTAAQTIISEEIDKVYVDPQDGTKLGFILTSMGFERQ